MMIEGSTHSDSLKFVVYGYYIIVKGVYDIEEILVPIGDINERAPRVKSKLANKL